MSYAMQLQPMIIMPDHPDEQIEQVYKHRISILIKMIYDDSPFTKDYYYRSYIDPEYLTKTLSDHLMCLMIRRDLHNFTKVYMFMKTHLIMIKYTSGLNVYFTDFIKYNLYDMIHTEMATMKLNNDNIIYLIYGKSSPIFNKLKYIFKHVKLIPDIKNIISEHTSSIWNYINIYRFLHSLSDDNINGILMNIHTTLYSAYTMDITDIKINPTLLTIILIISKKRNINIVTFNAIIKYLNIHTNISYHHIKEIRYMQNALALHKYQHTNKKIFI